MVVAHNHHTTTTATQLRDSAGNAGAGPPRGLIRPGARFEPILPPDPLDMVPALVGRAETPCVDLGSVGAAPRGWQIVVAISTLAVVYISLLLT